MMASPCLNDNLTSDIDDTSPFYDIDNAAEFDGINGDSVGASVPMSPVKMSQTHRETSTVSVADSPFLGKVVKSGIGALSLKEQEKLIDEVKKENFDLKLRVYVLEERLSKSTPAHMEEALAENVDLKIRQEAMNAELKSYKTLVFEAHRVVERLQQQLASNRQSSTATPEEVQRLRAELDRAQDDAKRAHALVQTYEERMAKFAKETRDYAGKARQVELDHTEGEKKHADALMANASQREEIDRLREELDSKTLLLQKFKEDVQVNTNEISMMSDHTRKLQESLARLEADRDTLLKERDAMRKSLEKAEIQVRMGPSSNINGSPRSSLDVLESKLLRELGQTTRRVHDLEKQTSSTAGERDTLQNQAKRLNEDLVLATKTIKTVHGKIAQVLLDHEVPQIDPDDIDGMTTGLDQLCNSMIREYQESRLRTKASSQQLEATQNELSNVEQQLARLSSSLEEAETKLVATSTALQTKSDEYHALESSSRHLQIRLRETVEAVPKYQRECQELTERVAEIEGQLSSVQTQLSRVSAERDELEHINSELQSSSIQLSGDLARGKDELATMQAAKATLYGKIVEQEDLLKAAQKKAEDLAHKVAHAEKIRDACEKQFASELKVLHAANGELKLQVNSSGTAKSELVHRLDQLDRSLAAARREKEELVAKLQSREADHEKLRNDHELLLLEHHSMTRQFHDRHQAIQKLEADLVKVRRDELAAKRNTDGLEHLQARVDSLSALNAFLKEQLEQKEKTILDLTSRVKKQEDEMRSTWIEVEQQSRKLKKREVLIGQALKRLEAINYVKGLTSPMVLGSTTAPESPRARIHTPSNRARDQNSIVRTSSRPETDSLGADVKEMEF